LNYYRNLDRNWEIQAALAGAPVMPPALYIAEIATSSSPCPAWTSSSPTSRISFRDWVP